MLVHSSVCAGSSEGGHRQYAPRWHIGPDALGLRRGSVMAYDLLIKNGRVVDGSGGPSFTADVAVHQGKIVGVGRFNESATRIINAEVEPLPLGSLTIIPIM